MFLLGQKTPANEFKSVFENPLRAEIQD
jgi:hypothetical protein